MSRIPFCVALLLVYLAGTSFGQPAVKAIPDNWKPTGLRPLLPSDACASSTFGGIGGTYAPTRAIDGNLGTKWVGQTAATPQDPQWIELQLPSPQIVTAVAVAGAPVGKDGFAAGAVQVSDDATGSFRTVAEISQAPSAHWLATFEPAKTSKIRLLVTKSGGESPHTDLNEIQILGPPLSDAQLKQQAIDALAVAVRTLQPTQAAADRLATQIDPHLAAVAPHLKELAQQLTQAAERLQQWNDLPQTERADLAARIDQAQLRARQWAAWIARMPGPWQARFDDLRAVRKSAAATADGKKVVSRRDGSQVTLSNNQVAITLDEPAGTWNATWLDGAQAAIRQVHFAVEAGGKRVSPDKIPAEIAPTSGKLGTGMQIRQRWGDTMHVQRELTIYEGKPIVVISGRIVNRTGRDLPLAAAYMVDLASQDGGWWYAGQAIQTPGVVTTEGLASLGCQPEGTFSQLVDAPRTYGGSGLLALAHQNPSGSLLIGYLTAQQARPDLSAAFQPTEGGTTMSAVLPFFGRILPPGATLELDPVYIAAAVDPYQSLERYADAVAASSQIPVRTGPTALWCSWYAHRMAMTEDLVLANAAVAAKHFVPLGLQIMQLDHGWQRGDVTGDWVANDRFPHGLKWLSEQLQSRFGLRLGVWISPTDVAETSELFRQHADWMLKDTDGKPRPNWRWYWKPNPMCYELDASRPEAQKWIEDTFARLSSEGVSYYKIDFISASAGEHFRQYNPQCTRGWGVLKCAMDALRRGAGPKAWIRYTQTPYLLTAGLGDSGIAGSDTLDAGLGGNIEVLRTNARSLAAGFWINDRLYHRELCDLSVRMHADIEEVRMRLAMMALAGCSVSFSDEFQYLPDSRIHMMQQCLPPGAPQMHPLDLYQRAIPSIWHIPCKTPFGAWDVVGLFNFENEPQERTIPLARLGLLDKTDVITMEFWQEKLLGVFRDQLTLTLPPQSSRVLLLHRAAGRPQVIGTDMHILGGFHEIQGLQWDADHNVLSGKCRRMPGISGRVYLFVPEPYRPHFDFPLTATSAQLTNIGRGLWMKEIRFDQAEVSWTVPFDGPTQKKETKPANEPVTTN